GATTVSATEDVSLVTALGKVAVDGKTTAEKGDITISAGSSEYAEGAGSANIVISENGALITKVGDINLDATNGDIHITDDVQAGRDLNVATHSQGSVYFDEGIEAGGNIHAATDNGNIDVGASVTAGQAVDLAVGVGAMKVGGDISGTDVNLTVSTVADDSADHIAIDLAKTVTATTGDVNAKVGVGDIVIGSNEDADTLHAAQNVTLSTDLGRVLIQGTTSTEKGDITISAASSEYKDGENNIILEDKGKIVSGRSIALDATNGDIHVTKDIIDQQDLTATTNGRGSIAFDSNVDVEGKVVALADTGDVTVGGSITGKESVSVATHSGNITVGQDITSDGYVDLYAIEQGDITVGDSATGSGGHITGAEVNIESGAGNIAVVKTVQATEDSVLVETGKGDITIGSNGPDVDTVTALQDVTIKTGLGKVTIKGKTSTEQGDILVSAASDTYEAGEKGQNIVIQDDGLLVSGRHATLEATNGDIHMTDAVSAKEDLNAVVHEAGSVYFDMQVDVGGNVTASTGQGDVVFNGDVSAQNNVWLSTEEGDIDINGSLSAKGDVAALAGEGNITFDGPVTAQSDVEAVTGKGYISANANITGASIAAETGQGSITVNGNLTSTLNDIELTAVDREPNNEDGNSAVNGSLDAARDVKLTSVNGDITLDGSVKADGAVTAGTSDGDINVNGDVTGASVAAKAGQGSVTVNGGVTA
ncbi:MAG: hypothetical protein J5492_02090, partial [Oxalobacter sp.]|nr:hypothetical protein [Oxalobacter sp.]